MQLFKNNHSNRISLIVYPLAAWLLSHIYIHAAWLYESFYVPFFEEKSSKSSDYNPLFQSFKTQIDANWCLNTLCLDVLLLLVEGQLDRWYIGFSWQLDCWTTSPVRQLDSSPLGILLFLKQEIHIISQYHRLHVHTPDFQSACFHLRYIIHVLTPDLHSVPFNTWFTECMSYTWFTELIFYTWFTECIFFVHPIYGMYVWTYTWFTEMHVLHLVYRVHLLTPDFQSVCDYTWNYRMHVFTPGLRSAYSL